MQEAFFFYRLPDEHERIYFGHSENIAEGIAESGYVIAPFNTQKDKTYTILAKPRTIYRGELEKWLDAPLPAGVDSPVCPESTSQSMHLQYVEQAQDWLKTLPNQEDSKLVISRLLSTDKIIRPSTTFLSLCNKYPKAYVFAFYTPAIGLWMGASPEMLLHSEPGFLTSLSLAGTRPSGTDCEWDKKNIQEQEIVTRYIMDVMQRHGLTPKRRAHGTMQAGPIEHISTIVFSRKSPGFDCNKLVVDLSPTPAISGFPRNEALEEIERIEHHSRSFYGGFSGYKEDNDRMHFFVTLRAMHIFTDMTVLYAGGGITIQSVASTEWEETCQKLSTLLETL